MRPNQMALRGPKAASIRVFPRLALIPQKCDEQFAAAGPSSATEKPVRRRPSRHM